MAAFPSYRFDQQFHLTMPYFPEEIQIHIEAESEEIL